jgi:hypothetical protein
MPSRRRTSVVPGRRDQRLPRCAGGLRRRRLSLEGCVWACFDYCSLGSLCFSWSVAAACGGGSESEVRNPDFVQLPPAAPSGQWVLFGHIRSLARKNGRFEMRFDPAWWLSGVAAERAAVEDKTISPGDPVPNDYYIVNEGHRLLTFVVAPRARVTILVDAGWQTKITVSELVQLLRGKNPRHRPLMGDSRPLASASASGFALATSIPTLPSRLTSSTSPRPQQTRRRVFRLRDGQMCE